MISIVVPIYNVEKYIEKLLESIVKQSYTDFELLLVDDGTPDKSIEIAKNYLENYSLNYKILRKENGGLSSARNYGLRHANGEYVLFVDSDDYLHRDLLKKLYHTILLKDCDFSCCSYQFINSQAAFDIAENNKTVFYQKEEVLKDFLKRKLNLVIPSILFKKDFLVENNLVFNQKIGFSEDQEFMWRCFVKSNGSVYLNEKLYGYYLREDSIMHSSSFNKIMSSYNEYSKCIRILIDENLNYNNTLRLIMPRWELGTLYTSAKLLDYYNFKKLYKEFDGRTLLFKMIEIKEIKAIALGTICSISPFIMYQLCRGIKLEK